MTPPLSSLILYSAKPDEMTTFYQTYFGHSARQSEGDRITELHPPESGLPLLPYRAAKGMRQGQAVVRPVFACKDVQSFFEIAAAHDPLFGKTHKADRCIFSNANDPSGNRVSNSGRPA